MLSKSQRDRIFRQAYIPEHLPEYVAAISGTQPYLHGDYLCYARGQHLIFVGYPLGKQSGDTETAYESACERFRPHTIALIAPKIWLKSRSDDDRITDYYYRLDLPLGRPDSAVAYMLRRAQREIQIVEGKFGEEHRRLVQEFISFHEVMHGHQYIFNRIGDYLDNSRSARLLEARKKDDLVAFTIVDLGSADYAYYMFHFRSSADRVPGASDCLFHEMTVTSEQAQKKALNLGLGISEGNRRFKEKWGGNPFLPHTSTIVRKKRFDWKTFWGRF
jgi:hypothetical protein